MIKTYLLTYLSIIVTYLILDGIWLGVVAKDSYVSSIGKIMREEFIIWPWVVFYSFYSFAILYLIILPNMPSASWKTIALSGAVMGAAAYGAYNLTCYGILKDWPLSITLKDWAWGTFITAAASLAGFYSYSKLIEE